jgi:transposase
MFRCLYPKSAPVLPIRQAARLDAWEGALRFLWNLAHEQRLMGLRTVRDRRRYYTAFDQQLELTDLRAEVPWLAEVPRNVCAQLLAELDKAWQRTFKKLASSPRFKKKGRDGVAICEPHPKTWSLVADGHIRFPSGVAHPLDLAALHPLLDQC